MPAFAVDQMLHLTIPGTLDVMGVGGNMTPLVMIGFNKDVAWTHTVSTGKRFTLYELKLDPADPTTYLVDGQPKKMTAKTVTLLAGSTIVDWSGEMSSTSKSIPTLTACG